MFIKPLEQTSHHEGKVPCKNTTIKKRVSCKRLPCKRLSGKRSYRAVKDYEAEERAIHRARHTQIKCLLNGHWNLHTGPGIVVVRPGQPQPMIAFIND